MADFSQVTITAFGSVGAGYAQVLAPLGAAAGLQGSTSIVLKSSLDQDVLISMDGGTTDHYVLSAGEKVIFDLGTGHSGAIHAKRRSAAPTSGELIITSWGK